MKYILNTCLLAGLAYTLMCVMLYVKQRSFLYFPPPESNHPDIADLRLDHNGVRLKIWQVNGQHDKAIIYFGGNAEDVAEGIEDIRDIFAGYTLYLVNYRGYAGSEGHPSENALLGDALFIYDAVQSGHQSIFAMGRSLGSGIALYLSVKKAIDKLVLITPYDSIENLARENFALFPVSLLLKDKYKAIDYAPAVDIPTLAVLAEHDTIIAPLSSQRLLQAIPAWHLERMTIANADHNNLSRAPGFYEKIADFLAGGQSG